MYPPYWVSSKEGTFHNLFDHNVILSKKDAVLKLARHLSKTIILRIS